MSDAWRLVPTNSTRPPRDTTSETCFSAWCSSGTVCDEVDDVDIVADAEDVRRHLRVPAVGLVAEVNASFQELAHAEIRQSHSKFLSGWPPRTLGERSFLLSPPEVSAGFLPGRHQSPCVEWRGI